MAVGMMSAEHAAARERARAAASFDEAAVPDYRLPDPLTCADGQPVATADQWPRRRAEILDLFARCVFGQTPQPPLPLRFSTPESGVALDGLARSTLVRGSIPGLADAPWLEILVLTPARAAAPVPVFAALNHAGNHSLHADPALPVSTHWLRDHPDAAAIRGGDAARWPLATILRRGYGVATMYNGDVAPDVDDGFRNGFHRLFYAPGQTRPADDEWGAIGAWAWGLSRIRDCLEAIPAVDARRVAVLGHSRLGKAALWAGAQDERFALVVSNASGCGGAALSRRRFGERQALLNARFPHWFCAAFRQWDEREAELPVDQHMLLALIAPRPLYVASAAEDLWADPRGEFLSAVGADPVYRLLGTDGLPATDSPPLDHPLLGTIGYHCRRGSHDLTPYDWERFLAFAAQHGLGPTPTRGAG